jgi:2-phospho-L-lactate guanylyltransferase
VLATLHQVEALATILVVTPDAEVAGVSQRRGARILREDRITGHSPAVIAGFAEARANGAAQALTLPADAPLATPEELRTLLDATSPSPSPRPRPEGPSLTVVPSRDGDGTNAILVSPPDAFAPSFGPGSFARHLAHASASGIACRTLKLPGLGLDIDEPHDLSELLLRTRANPRYAFLDRYALYPAGAGDP